MNTKSALLATTALLLAAAPTIALAADAPAAPVRQSAVPGDQAVLIFTPDFFADARPNTALDMVNRVPGFSVNDGDGARGFEGAVGNVLINGSRPASKNDTGSNVLGRTVASQVERIELIRGGAPGIEMQGYSVVANIILKNTTSREHIATFNASLFEGGQDLYGGSYQFTERKGDRTWGVTLSDGISSSDSNGAGPLRRVGPNGELLRAEDYYNDGYGGGNSIRGNFSSPLLGGKVDLTARYGINDWHNINRQTAPGVRREALFDEDTKSGEVGVVYTRPLSERLKLETRFIHEFEEFDNVATSRNREADIEEPIQRFAATGDSSETILRGLLRFERSAALEFEGGGEIAYNMLEVEQAYSVGGTPIPLPSASVKVEETRGELFGKATWRINPKWTLEGGLRLESSTISQSGDAEQEKSFVYAKPRLLTTWTPMANTQVRLRIERTVGQLDFGDFAASAELQNESVFGGNVDLQPEQRWVSELTFEKRFWGEGIVSVGLRHDEITDAIDVIPLDGGYAAVGNIGDGTLDQLVLNVTVPTDKLGLSGGKFGFKNTWNHTEVTDPTTGETRPISGIRASQATISFQQDVTRLKLQWGGAWIPLLGQKNYRPDQISGWRGHDYYELWAEYKPTPTLAIRGQINIWDDFNVERTEFGDRIARPIAFVENRFVDPRTFYQIRLRKTF
ncbi:Outer membrane receptor for ferrienterochelin and colicins [Brevundimonas diminuta]|uniref:TonB-dependent receptor plug domain-containing protein n=1 Tax=Brevundimonas diminuta TaxID=293 RepID=UPI000207F3D3|nr:TonB-dependent receptor [Brevundimonas diminuta]EGF95506.1 tonB dependent receptor family protein [Brevundimonas diminuta ATCC 11568]OWR17346.1 TonB-dependent receptor [Brevundimonas diminuta]WQE45686.1 TonB-dependent receptor [Brevundimonas diminuta]SPU47292.1 Outer membrane receptor for ferrienterochelin and colicins [Brevundimonas diminuta]SUW14903.1 Outer membrane receptor for ferrienterochelin and colicins [Brevundimonas diminuta]